jgi:hypothetical protein
VAAKYASTKESELAPGSGLRLNRCLQLAVLNLRMCKGQAAIVGVWKAGRVDDIADLQRLAGLGGNPEAACAVLQHNGGAGLIVSDGSMNPKPPREIADVSACDDLVHRRYGQGPRAGTGALENLDVIE